MGNRRKVFALLFSSLTLSTQGLANDKITGIEVGVRGKDLIRSDLISSTSSPATQQCYIFPKFVVVQVDTHEVGADQIIVRERTAKLSPDQLCDALIWKSEVKLKVPEAYFRGAVGEFVFLQSADTFGADSGFWIYDRRNGKKMFEGSFHIARPFEVKSKSGEAASLHYFGRLKASCSVAIDKEKCWSKIREENAIPKTLTLGSPDCTTAIKTGGLEQKPEALKLPQALQLFAELEVKDVKAGKIEWLRGKAICEASP